MSRRDPFHVVRARAVLAVIALCVLGFLLSYGWLEGRLGEAGATLVVEIGIYATAGGLLAFLSRRVGVDLGRLVGPAPTPREALRTAALAIPVIGTALGAIWTVYVPLSFVAPGFVETWLLDPTPIFFESDGSHPLLPNLLVVATICVLVPWCEEFVFRGLFLHRWALRWGLVPAILASSLLFGALHADALGSALFGLIAAVLYLETRSLWTPVILHAANNTLACLWLVGEIAWYGAEQTMDLQAFREAWWVGALGWAVGLPWAIHFFRTRWCPEQWQLPHAQFPDVVAAGSPLRHAPPT